VINARLGKRLFQPVDEVYFDARSNNIPLALSLIAVFNIIGYLFLFFSDSPYNPMTLAVGAAAT